VAFGQITVRDLTSGHGRLLRCVKASQPDMASSVHRFQMCYGKEFTDRLFGLRRRAATGNHEFDRP
jgi:hypothetical protein